MRLNTALLPLYILLVLSIRLPTLRGSLSKAFSQRETCVTSVLSTMTPSGVNEDFA